MLLHLFAAERLSPPARERVRSDALLTALPVANGAGAPPRTETPLTWNAGPAAQGWDETHRQDSEARLVRNRKRPPHGPPRRRGSSRRRPSTPTPTRCRP